MKSILTKIAGFLIAALPFVFVSCEQDSDMHLALAVDHTALNLKQEGGTTNFTIYSTGEWNVVLSKPVDWMSLSVLAGKGKGNVEISSSPNYGVVRRVDLIIQGQGETKIIKLTQSGEDVIFNFVEEMKIGKDAQTLKALFESNLGPEMVSVRDSIAYQKFLLPDEDEEDAPEAEVDWISGIDLTEEGFLKAEVKANEGNRPRKAQIWLIYEDAREKVHKAYLDIVQDIVTIDPAPMPEEGEK